MGGYVVTVKFDGGGKEIIEAEFSPYPMDTLSETLAEMASDRTTFATVVKMNDDGTRYVVGSFAMVSDVGGQFALLCPPSVLQIMQAVDNQELVGRA